MTCPGDVNPINNPNKTGPVSNGCGPASIPVQAPSFSFEECCKQHDICYGTCRSSKRECDNDFYRCMSCSCQEEYSGFVTEDSCLAAACSYHQAVHDYGCDAFSIAQSQSCLCPNSTKALRYSKESGDEAHIPMNKFGIFPIAHKVDGLCDPPFEADCGSVPENSLFGLFDDLSTDTLIIIFSIVGGFFLVLLLAAVCCFCLLHRSHQRRKQKNEAFDNILDEE